MPTRENAASPITQTARAACPGAAVTQTPGRAKQTESAAREAAQCPLRLSVIIPTKNRPEDLCATVATLLKQTELPSELIIVDQSKTGGDAEAIRRLFAASPAGAASRRTVLTYVRDPGISGGSQARNRGIELARGDIWLFLDDDVELEPNFVRELALAYDERPEAAGISGVVTNYCSPPWQSRLWFSVFLRGPFRDDRQLVYQRADSMADADPVRASRLGGGLMSFRAAAVDRVRFDENLTGVCDGEDVDFCMQLGPHSQLFIAPRARLVHKQSPNGRATDHWLRRFTQANHYLYHRHWKQGIVNRCCFVWLNAGLGLAASLAAARRGSLQPYRALWEGARLGRKLSGGRLASAGTSRPQE